MHWNVLECSLHLHRPFYSLIHYYIPTVQFNLKNNSSNYSCGRAVAWESTRSPSFSDSFLAPSAAPMDSQELQSSDHHQQPRRAGSLASTLKPSSFLLSSVLVLLLAVSVFVFIDASFHRSQQLKRSVLSHLTFLKPPYRLFRSRQNPKRMSLPDRNSTSSLCVLWMAPFLSGGGYSSEAWSYILALRDHLKGIESEEERRFRLAIEQHGDLESSEFWEGLPKNLQSLAFELYQTECEMKETIVICHSEPGAWNPPLFQTLPCPPTAYQNFKAVIGRTMFETDRVKSEHVNRCNAMDYVWVPSDFHIKTFTESGVDPSKLVKIIQPIDTEFFDPAKHKPFDLSSVAKLVLGEKMENVESKTSEEFIFLSIFKWEYRKGWDILLKSYLQEFSNGDGVSLYLLTNPYHGDGDFTRKIMEFVEKSDIKKPSSGWAPIYVIDKHIAQTHLPRVYRAAKAFVLPSRGEGWGRPLVEAMAMSLPVIATNWSGPTEYLTEKNGYPVPVERMSEVKEEPFKGHLWAEPSVTELQGLLREVMTSYDEARARGRAAREDMIQRFSPKIVGDIVFQQIQRI